MNIILDTKRFSLGNASFLDTKRNIIMDGNFTKIIYSNEWFTMNGIYFLFPIEIIGIQKIMNKMIMKFHPYHPTNLSMIQDFAKMEYRLIEYYKQMNQCSKKTSNLLAKQLYSGTIKIYKDYNGENYASSISSIDTVVPHYVMKISGIWETRDEVGLTFKLIHAMDRFI
jgi:hypothetical protein